METDNKHITNRQISQVPWGEKGREKRTKSMVAILYVVVRERKSLCLCSEQREQPVQRSESGGGWSRVSERREGQITQNCTGQCQNFGFDSVQRGSQ